MSVALLFISIAALSIGPLIVRTFSARKGVQDALDGFVTIGIGGLVLFHVLPPAVAAGGYIALVFLMAGMILPTAVERLQHGRIRAAHAAALVLAFLALAIHALVDGVALSQADSEVGQALPAAIAVVLHRIPEGLAVWMLLRASHGLRATTGVMFFIAAATVLGFASGPTLVALLQGASFGWFQAFLSGSLLHVIFHAHEHDHSHDHGDPHGHGHAHDHANNTAGSLAPVGRTLSARGTLSTATPQRFPQDGLRFSVASTAESSDCCGVDPWEESGRTRVERWLSLLDVRSVRMRLPELIGATLGVGMVALLSWVEHGRHAEHSDHTHGVHAHGVHAHGHGSSEHLAEGMLAHAHVELFDAVALERLLHLALDAAPLLLLGYLLSSLIFRFFRPQSLRWLNEGGRWSAAWRGILFGVLMPVRACGVVPVFESLWDRGARFSGATSFLLATPQLRMETLLFSIPLLGLPLMGIRVVGILIVAWLVAVLAGVLVNGAEQTVSSDAHRASRLSTASSVRQGLIRLVDDTAPWVVFGLVVAVLVEPSSIRWFSAVPWGVELVFFGALGVPLYICATGATPVAAALIFAGASPGGAIVFLLAGPMAKIAAFGAIRRRRGAKVALVVVLAFWLLVLGIGAATNLLFPEPSLAVLGLHDHTSGNALQWLALLGVGILFGWSLLRRGPRAWLNTIVAGDHG